MIFGLSKLLLLSLLACLLPTVTIAAQDESSISELPTDPVLAALIEQSLSVRPEVGQAAELVKAARERVPQVGALPDPMLQLGVQNDSFTSWNVGKMETSWYSIMASQTFPWPGKLQLRSAIAELGATQAEQNLSRLRLSTEAEVRRAYLNLMLARERLALLDRLDSISRRAASVAQARYEAGTGTQSDVLRSQLEIKRIRQRRLSMQIEATTALQTLNRLRAHPLDEPITPPKKLVDLTVPPLRTLEAALEKALARSPELASARAGVLQGERSISLAQKSYWPDFTISLGVMPRGGDFPPMWLATVGVPLPVFAASKQSRAVAESQLRMVANKRNVQVIEQVLKLRVDQRHIALSATLETIRIYQEGLLAESEVTAESTLAQYEVGKVTFLSVLEANAGLISDQDSFLQVLAEAQRLQIQSAEISLDPVSSQDSAMGTQTGTRGSAMQPGAGVPNGAMPAPPTSTTPSPANGSSEQGM